MINRRICAHAAALLIGSSAAAQVYVDGNRRVDDGDGFSWATAFKYLQDGIATAAAGGGGGEVWVAATDPSNPYVPDESRAAPDGTNDPAASFPLLEFVAIYGGFAGHETDRAERAPELNETVISATDPERPGYQAYRVVSASQVDSRAILSGFAVANGKAHAPGQISGAGIHIFDSSCVITRCRFVNNSASNFGGAVYAELRAAPGPAFSNCEFVGNTAWQGAGVLLFDTLPGPSSPVFSNCLFAKNVAGRLGGGCDLNGPLAVSFIGCTFADNRAQPGAPLAYGGGLRVPTVNFSATLRNCILWGNSDIDGVDESTQLSDSSGNVADPQLVTVTTSCVQGLDVFAGDGNIGDDPLFVNPFNDASDYHLCFGSPAREAGNDDDAVLDLLDVDDDGITDESTPDLDLAERIIDGDSDGIATVDMGAYEYACVGDVVDDGVIDFADVIDLLLHWGPCPGCPEDVHESGIVDVADILVLLLRWGPCPCGPIPLSMNETLTCMGLTEPDWDDFLHAMERGTQVAQDNYSCWVEHYYEVHCDSVCLCGPTCPGADPFGGHP